MKADQDYIQDIAQMRTMMERSTRFLSLSGMAGVMAGIYALAGALIAYSIWDFNPDELIPTSGQEAMPKVIGLGLIVFFLALTTAIILSQKKATKRGESFWNPTSRRLLINTAIPFLVGGVVILILLSKGLIGLAAPLSLVFYGLALYNAGKFTYEEIKILGLAEIALGLFSLWFIQYGLLCWALGFGIAHIIYGIYMHYRYER
jgi:hypothetical protein